MARTTKRTTLRPAPFLVLLLIINVAVGLCASPLTAVRKVRVDGAKDEDRPRIEAILRRLKGEPCGLINKHRIESLVMDDSKLRSARLDRNLFGSAVLTLGYRNPVARFQNHTGMALSSEGVVYRADQLPEDLPTLSLTEDEPKPFLTVSADWPCASIALLAARVREFVPSESILIEYGTGSTLCLNIGTGKAILGSCDSLDLKLAKLRKLLADDPDYLSKIKSVNLVNPETPMIVPK